MISGSPPTERNARTGLFTPPTSTFSARSNISRERLRSGFTITRVTLISAPLPLFLQPWRYVFRVIRQNSIRSCALDPRKNFQHHPLLLHPSLFHRGLHHRILAAHIVSRNPNVKVF